MQSPEDEETITTTNKTIVNESLNQSADIFNSPIEQDTLSNKSNDNVNVESQINDVKRYKISDIWIF